MSHQSHPYHMVNPSPWPIIGSGAALLITSGLILWFHKHTSALLKLSLLLTTLTAYQWWRDVVRESTFQGHHTPPVQKNLRYGMALFIISEVMFFTGFFWALFYVSVLPAPEIGGHWPPTGITPINPTGVPLLNTAILLSSGATITWAHHAMKLGQKKETQMALLLTITLGLYFSFIQLSEYKEAPFTISDCIYGSVFFVATGFHGLHVIIGTTFLITCLLRIYKNHLTTKHHFGFEAAAWYWHFVDVVWLFLFISVYCS
uniref:Cytochrome c oxidase subunit 3 n=1 Tax=Rena humilis TaxID=711330 RepID=Q6I7Y1_RENHU|nr:cytochrome c oxidase subunit III [Rena humilis]BAD24743.1 cytochrome oxidase subunit 3 [Rena humilis]